MGDLRVPMHLLASRESPFEESCFVFSEEPSPSAGHVG
ncbi:hypothetical protein AKJ09_07220 [Labilithrix luteola]|uniref:Uncharacterized protein n=1 Tax=Labilithrix luteola TaxID=1391654 RepID=A0A0K1Q4G6_9BACT|nr:hypothetical protein AKJ09_07220 [Labilithrix luteola]